MSYVARKYAHKMCETIEACISLHNDAVRPELLHFAACVAFLFHLLLYVYGKHLMSCPDSYVPRQTFRGQFTSTKCKFFHHFLRIGGS